MSLTGTTHKTHVKEFIYAPAGITVKLVCGFENDICAYHAVEIKSGQNLSPLDANWNKLEAHVFGPSLTQYMEADKVFKKAVLNIL